MPVGPLSQPGASSRLPSPPTAISASAVAGGGATVAFTASENPGKPSGDYVATSSPSGITASAASSPITFNPGALTAAQAYTFTVVKQSGSGITSNASTASGSITAFYVPSAPSISVARQASQTLRITLTVAANANGSTITKYQYRIKSTGSYGSYIDLSGTSGPWDISGLNNGTSYTVQVRAVNNAGDGAASNEPSATPFTVPSAPVISMTNNCDTVDWTWSSGGDGGSSITSYEYALSTNGEAYSPSGNTSTTGTSYPGSITNTYNTNIYTLRVRAVNAAGAGSYATATSTPWTRETRTQTITDDSCTDGTCTSTSTSSISRSCQTCGTESGTRTTTGTRTRSRTRTSSQQRYLRSGCTDSTWTEYDFGTWSDWTYTPWTYTDSDSWSGNCVINCGSVPSGYNSNSCWTVQAEPFGTVQLIEGQYYKWVNAFGFEYWVYKTNSAGNLIEVGQGGCAPTAAPTYWVYKCNSDYEVVFRQCEN